MLDEASLQPSGKPNLLIPLSSFVSQDFSFVVEASLCHPWNWWQCQPEIRGSSSRLQAGKLTSHYTVLQSVFISSDYLLCQQWCIFFPRTRHPFKLQHWTYFKQVSSLSLWYDPSAKYPGQPSDCLGLLLWNKWNCGSISIPDFTLWEAQLKLSSSFRQLSSYFLHLPSPTIWRTCFQFFSAAAGFIKSMGWNEFCCYHTCSTHSTNGQIEKLGTKKKACEQVSVQTDGQTCSLAEQNLFPCPLSQTQASSLSSTLFCTVRVTSHLGLACPICKPFNNDNPLSCFTHQNAHRLLPNKRTWQMSRG